MHKLTLLFALAVTSTATFAATAGTLRYTSAGLPDFSGFVVGSTTLDDVEASMGRPINVQTDGHGQPASASFYLPLQGQNSVSDNPATSAAKGSFFSSIRSHASSLVSRVPGVGGMVGAAAVDQGAAAATGQGAKVWSCQVLFDHGRYLQGSCSTINRPIG